MSCHYFLEGERTRIQQQFLKPIFDCQTLYHVHMYLVEFENLVRSGPFVHQALIRITLSTADPQLLIHNTTILIVYFFMQFIIEDILYISYCLSTTISISNGHI